MKGEWPKSRDSIFKDGSFNCSSTSKLEAIPLADRNPNLRTEMNAVVPKPTVVTKSDKPDRFRSTPLHRPDFSSQGIQSAGRQVEKRKEPPEDEDPLALRKKSKQQPMLHSAPAEEEDVFSAATADASSKDDLRVAASKLDPAELAAKDKDASLTSSSQDWIMTDPDNNNASSSASVDDGIHIGMDSLVGIRFSFASESEVSPDRCWYRKHR